VCAGGEKRWAWGGRRPVREGVGQTVDRRWTGEGEAHTVYHPRREP